MNSAIDNAQIIDRRKVIVGQVLSGLAILFLTIDAGGKLIAPEMMIAHSPPLGLPADPSFYQVSICCAARQLRIGKENRRSSLRNARRPALQRTGNDHGEW